MQDHPVPAGDQDQPQAIHIILIIGPHMGSGRYSLGADTKPADKARIWYQAGLVTACPLGFFHAVPR
jgi:hypothetical protein